MNTNDDPYIPVTEAARLIRPPRGRKTHCSTIVRWALAGKVRAERRGRWWYVHRGDLLALRLPVPKPKPQVLTRGERIEQDAWTRATLERFRLPVPPVQS